MKFDYGDTMSDVQQLFKKSSSAFENGRLRKAGKLAKRILELSPDHLGALMIAGASAVQLGDTKDGGRLLQKAVSVAPQMPETHYNLAKVFLAEENWGQAEEALSSAIRVNPAFLPAYFDLAVLCETTKRYAAAERYYNDVIQMNKELPDAWLGLGNAQRNLGKLSDAVESYQWAITINPNLASVYNNLANVLVESGRFDKAETAMKAALQRDHNQPMWWNNLGIHLRRQEKWDEGVEAHEKAMELDAENQLIRLNYGHALREAGQVDAAIEIFRLLVEDYPDPGHMHCLLASALTQDGQYEEAMAVCDAFLEYNPADPSILSYKAVIWNEEGRDDEYAAFMDFDRMVVPVDVETPASFEDMDAFNAALSDHIQNHPSLEYSPDQSATRSGFHTGELLDDNKGPIADLEEQILSAVRNYCQSFVIDPGHPFFAVAPPNGLDLTIWSVVLKSQGHQDPHTHPGAWLSGVYYAKVPDFVGKEDAGDDGCIEFGLPNSQFFFDRPPPVKVYQPREGRMFLFPSFLFHRTIPYESDETRISIAFDLVRRLD